MLRSTACTNVVPFYTAAGYHRLICGGAINGLHIYCGQVCSDHGFDAIVQEFERAAPAPGATTSAHRLA